MKNCSRKFVVTLVLIISVLYTSFGQQFGWRGPGRTGVYNEKGLLKSWPESGPSLLWDATGIGKGYSSATVTDDAIYITGSKGEKDVLSAFTQEGRKMWEVEYGNITPNVNSPESRGTPIYYNGKIFVVSGKGDLACITKDGKMLWTVNYYEKYKAPIQRFGISESTIIQTLHIGILALISAEKNL